MKLITVEVKLLHPKYLHITRSILKCYVNQDLEQIKREIYLQMAKDYPKIPYKVEVK